MREAFVRTAAVLGTDALETLQNKHVAVFGLGGVGAACSETLARCGVGKLSLIDGDVVQESNLNRQLIALHSTIAQDKTEAAAARLKDINPDIRLSLYQLFFDGDSAQKVEIASCDYIVDAIDTVTSKLLIAQIARAHSIPIIACMGMGNKVDPAKLRFADIYDTSVCPLCREVRKLARKAGIDGLEVLFSTEKPVTHSALAMPGGRHVPGSVPFLPPVAGMMIAGKVILQLSGFSADSSAMR
ncbi:MAG: tRNA threonylcarbamoyladenosine dehydratase [Eubacteriales bacterium]|jgi:tRNA A37 threonylcarbamoyladenosine dehydratase|nr:tRNA threonylcarbamoyladenosine dehydratase [Eubacteriales bacterium]MDD4104593.1 tRNA threonylcarbamoyladenosine dehydratase [Eubacteriales bacterium]MDD4710050.1 tRNA threonylcarbamoyladenosine dehydratase [Eubacteriales bacterium]NLO15817.1 tRNA threonylcarbamoyladenosine dehydratase [Clostridiales bacterium]